MSLPTDYEDGMDIHADTDDNSGGGINGWMTAINDAASDASDALTLLGGTGTATLTNPSIQGYTEKVQALGTCSSSKTIDALTNGTLVTATLTASTQCTFTMPTATAGTGFGMVLHQAASTGGGTAVFTGVKWPGGTAPTVTATAGAIDRLSFEADGTYWYGTFAQAFA